MKKTLRHLLYGIAVLLGAALATACGEYFVGVTTAGEMQLSRKVIPLVVGDRYSIPVTFSPVELSNNTVYWLTEDNTVARFVNDTLVALSEGQTLAYAWSSIDLLRDTCVVVVMPGLYEPMPNYRYDMVIYASVMIHGTPLTPDNQHQYFIGAYVNDELRGIGRVEEAHGVTYTVIRVWSPYDYGEEVTLRCYYIGQARTELFPVTFTFDGERHGTLSQLYPLVLDEDAEEFTPTINIDWGGFGTGGEIEEPDTIVVDMGAVNNG